MGESDSSGSIEVSSLDKPYSMVSNRDHGFAASRTLRIMRQERTEPIENSVDGNALKSVGLPSAHIKQFVNTTARMPP